MVVETNNLSANADDAASFYGKGEQFRLAANVLELKEVSLAVGVLPMPAVTLRAFSVEAFFKSLLHLEGANPPWVHDLRKLFDLLSSASKQVISDDWDKYILPHVPKSAPPGLEKVYFAPKNLLEALDQSANAFLSWRYSTGTGIGFWTVANLQNLVRARILELRPDWERSPPDVLGQFHNNS